MRFSAALLVAAAGLVAAQTTTYGPPTTLPTAGAGTCIGETTLQACMTSEKGKLANCKVQDYICMCDNYKLIARCFDSAGCADDARRAGPDAQVAANCAAAEPLMSSTKANAPTGAVSSSLAAVATQAVQSSLSAVSSTMAAASSTSTPNGAVMLSAPVGGFAAFLLGVAGLL